MITIHKRDDRQDSAGANDGMVSGPGLLAKPSTSGASTIAGIDQRSIDPGVVFDQPNEGEFDILTYIVDGILDYRDSSGRRHMLMGGEVEVTDAGDGVTYSESNASHSEPLYIVRASIRPRQNAVKSSGYQQKYFSDDAKLDQLCLIASGDGRDESLTVSPETNVYAALLRDEDPVHFQRSEKRQVWLQVARGNLLFNNVTLGPGDAAKIYGDKDTNLRFQANGESEFLLFDFPAP